MNDAIQEFARTQLKEMLAQCTEAQQLLFKRMYSHNDLSLDICVVVDNMPEDKLDWAMQQCQRTLDKASK
ncbi:unnamed protein product [marine sediment metagenome]|uniref:Uncharacterized protein n=1 Tax=marine sediment metagenome TaxID=412755 RepID=X0WVE9_9ZZZZ